MSTEIEYFRLPPVQSISVGGLKIGDDRFFLIAGPCVIESRDLILQIAASVKQITDKFNIPYIFKASFDKANRTSLSSPRGPGLMDGLESLKQVKEKIEVPVLTDIHEAHQVKPAAEIIDCLQIPAFLCRQTDLLIAVGATQKAVNIKKGQFVAPDNMKFAVEKVESTTNKNIFLTERGATFGYGNLVVDMRSIPIMRQCGYPVVFDATHSVQLPGGEGTITGGQREFIFPLAKAAIAAGASGLFIETHPFPPSALSDATNMLPLNKLEELLERILPVYDAVRNR